MSFEDSFLKIIGIEGRYSKDPDDAGGETMFGITSSTARTFNYRGPMRDMPLSVATDIYRRGWWDLMRLDDVTNAAGERVADELFECGVNISPRKAVKFIQRALNSFNQGGTHYPDIEVDGNLGPATLATLRAFILRRKTLGEVVMLNALNAQQGTYYLERGEARKANENFMFGWFAHRVHIT
jgi:lysozyme family protein